jgi:hypothetical protein
VKGAIEVAYDEGLAERIRDILQDRQDVVEKKMFGGLAFMVKGHMAVGIVKEDLMARVGPDAHDALIKKPHARLMDFAGRPMKGFLFVGPKGVDAASDLARWVAHSVAYADSLPHQGPRKGPARPKTSQRRLPARNRD